MQGEHIFLDTVSVGATINIMLAAAKIEGVTVIEHAAREPHIVAVANFLNTMGANIRGAGTDVIRITGVPVLPGNVSYSIIPDQIEAGTYMLAAALTRGDVTVRNIIPKHMEPLSAKLEEMPAWSAATTQYGVLSRKILFCRQPVLEPCLTRVFPRISSPRQRCCCAPPKAAAK